MQAAVHPSLYPSLAIAALVAWRLYARIRRVIGRQKLSTVRPWLTVTLFPMLLIMLMLGAMTQPIAATALLAGCAIGVALGIIGHRLTRFEVTPEGLYYTPNAHLGIALSLLLAGRIAWRVLQLNVNSVAPASPYSASFVNSPLTLLIFGTLAGYYVSYAIGLLRWHRQVGDSLPPATPPSP